MRVEVLIFGAAAVSAKSDRVTVEVEGASTVRTVLAAMRAQHPTLRPALPPADSGRLAVNQAFASGDHPIKPVSGAAPGDEVALITLVGGG
jgi:molybdopterin converting factor small subunit